MHGLEKLNKLKQREEKEMRKNINTDLGTAGKIPGV